MTSAPSAGRLLVNRYALVEVIGHGPASVVWRARDEQSGQEVAVKEIEVPRGSDDVESSIVLNKVLRDGREAATFRHPGAVPVHEVFDESRRVYVVMDVFAGPTLAQTVADRGPLPPEQVARLGTDLLDTLQAAHGAGLLHRAVTPSNVVLPEGAGARLSDFAVSASLIPTADPAPSPYRAPEQTATTGGSPAADLWSLGATLRFALGGEPPGDDGQSGDGQSGDARADDDGGLRAVVGRLLAVDPAERPDAAAARRMLQDAAGTAEGPDAASETGSSSAAAATDQEADAKTTREPWFFPVPVEVVPGSELELLEVEPDRPPPPPPRSMSRWRVVGIAVMTVGLCFFMLALFATRTGRRVRLGGEQTVVVPPDWFVYTDPQTGFSLSRPPDWRVVDHGTATDFVHPTSGAFLRVDTVAPLDQSPNETWKRLERAFSAHSQRYERVRLVPTTFQGRPASIWEYRYTENSEEIQVVQLGFYAGERPMVLRFQALADDWDRYQPTVAAFESSFRIPA